MIDNTVLIIDDDIWMQRILSKTLQSYGFTNTLLASNGFDGIGLAVEHRPALIILDILMPELSGHLTLKILKHIKVTKNIPVVMVSALSDTENLGLAVKSGTAGFISKPFTRATVFEKLIAIFGREQLEKMQIPDGGAENTAKPEETPNVKSEPVPEKDNNEKTDSEQEEKKPDKSVLAKTRATKDHLLKHYQEDEKRSIESIKKLLLKTRK